MFVGIEVRHIASVIKFGIAPLMLAAAVGCSQGVKDSGNDMNPFGDPTYGSGDASDSDDSASSGETTGIAPSEDTDEGSSSDGGSATSGATSAGECGNGTLEDGEMCDGEDFGGDSCSGYGFESGSLVCDETCQILTEACFSCGDGERSLTEACDGADFAGETCQSLGYGGGTLACAADCASVDTASCTPLASCGDNTRNGTEECDGADLGGASCESLGFDQGNLGCNAGSCTLNTAGCSYLNCAGQGDFCLFDQDNPQSNCCPSGVGGNVLGICVLAVCQ